MHHLFFSLSVLSYNSITYTIKKIFCKNMSDIPWIKLPNSASGFFLVLHVGLLFFWLYNRLDSNCNPISILLPVSISGLIVGFIMYYWVEEYYVNISEYEYRSSSFPYWSVWFIALFFYFLVAFFIYIFSH